MSLLKQLWRHSYHAAPVLQNYMERMMAAGYSENYRLGVLKTALAIYDDKVEKDKDGTTPLNRPKGYRKGERRAEKRRKRNSWGTKGGHTAPIIVPSTPNGELARRLRTIAESEAVPGLRFKVVERGGRKIVNQLQKTNPAGSPGCVKEDCPVCKQPGGGGGGCHKNNVTYQYTCEKDGAVYTGETGRNLYTRGLEHLDKQGRVQAATYCESEERSQYWNINLRSGLTASDIF